MNARDKELALQAWTENDWEGYLNIKKLMALIRADEREACAKVCDALAVKTTLSSGLTVFDASDCAAAIRARGNT